MMMPQERIDAILASRAPASWKVVLMAMSSHMDDNCRNCRAKVETFATLSTLSERQTRQVIRDMLKASIITRVSRGYHKPPWTNIGWSILAEFAGVAKTARGGKRCQDKGAKTASSPGKDCLQVLAKTAPDPDSDPVKDPDSDPSTRTNAPDGAGIQEQDHERDQNHSAGLDRTEVPAGPQQREHAGGLPGDEPEGSVDDGEGGEPAGADPEVRDVSEAKPAILIHAAWKAAHNTAKADGIHTQGQKRSKAPTKSVGEHITARIADLKAQGVTRDDAVAVLLHMVGPWLWTAKKGHAPLLRDGENTGLFTLFKPTRFEARYSQAEGHMEQGATPAHNGHIPSARAWDIMLTIVSANRSQPERLHDNDGTNHRMRAATRLCGGWRELGMVTDYNRKRIGEKWCAGYEGANA